MKKVIAYVALGSNQGDRKMFIKEAQKDLERNNIKIKKASIIYETEPLYKADGDTWFLNQVIAIKTSLEALELLKLLQTIEVRLGRHRAHPPGPRNIDLDILLYGSEIIDLPSLQVPHPRMHQRNCVLIPLIEIAPQLKDPISGKPFKKILLECPDKNKVTPFLK